MKHEAGLLVACETISIKEDGTPFGLVDSFVVDFTTRSGRQRIAMAANKAMMTNCELRTRPIRTVRSVQLEEGDR